MICRHMIRIFLYWFCEEFVLVFYLYKNQDKLHANVNLQQRGGTKPSGGGKMGSSLLTKTIKALCHHPRALPDGFCGIEAHIQQFLLECTCYGGWGLAGCAAVFRPDVFFSQLAPTLMLASRFFSQAECCAASKGGGGGQLIHWGCQCTPMQSHSAAFGFLQTGSISILSQQRRLRSTGFTLRRPEHTGRLQRFKQTQSTTTTTAKIQFNRENKQSRSWDTRVMNTWPRRRQRLHIGEWKDSTAEEKKKRSQYVPFVTSEQSWQWGMLAVELQSRMFLTWV